MCGIAGIVKSRGASVDPALLRNMLATLAHRGPDGTGVHVETNVGLGHVRLSIIDLAGGHQPMSVDDDSLWITFNGEIFNYIELREELEKRGHRFKTRSDTEVILRLYREKGVECVHDLNGQWAFAIWDKRERKVFFSRDRLGVRPLFYTLTNGDLVFASEIKAILTCPGTKRELNLQALDQIFTFWVTLPPRTAFEDIRQLPPGHSMTYQDGRLQTWQYWSPHYSGQDEPQPDTVESQAEELLALLNDAVRIRLRADVPVGAYLSGGIDSTVTTALVLRHAQNRLRTFSVAFEDSEFDESCYQREASRYLNTQHEEVRCSTQDIGRIFPDVVWHVEQPILRTAPAPLFLLSGLVRKAGFKVVLTGEGSDELLGGYDIFKEDKIRRFWGRQPDSRLRPQLLRRLYPYLPGVQKQPEAYLRHFFRVRPQDMDNPFFSHLTRWDLTAKLKSFFSPAVKASLSDYDGLSELRESMPSCAAWPSFCRAQYLETMYLLPGYILSSQGDRMAMAHSVEGRYPFLDYRVAEFAANLHPSLKMHVLNEKYLLKKAASGMVPPAILQRKKQPYRAPDGKSFFAGRTLDYVEGTLSAEQITKDNIFDPGPVQKLVTKFKSANAVTTKDDMALVGILSTQLLLQKFQSYA